MSGVEQPPPPPPDLPPPLGSNPPPPPGSSAFYFPPPPTPLPPPPSFGDQQARQRSITGITLGAVGFGLLWIPYVSWLGGLFLIIGIIFLYLGRWGFDERHHNLVVVGGALYLVVFLALIVVTAGLAVALFSAVTSTSTTSQIGTSLTSALDTFFVAAAILGLLSALAYVLLVYALADSTTQKILWAAFLAQAAVGTVVLFFVVPQVNSAVSQATSGSSLDLGPISALQTTDLLFGLLNIVPCLLFLWAYLRVRESAMHWDRVRPGSIPPRPFSIP